MKKYFFTALSFFAITTVASAHEVYVLDHSEIAGALSTPGFDPLAVIMDNLDQFAFWAVLVSIVIIAVFFFSISRPIERALDPILIRIKPFGFAITRVAFGLSMIAGAYNHSIFGPEIKLDPIFGPYTNMMTIALAIIGALITLGTYTRMAAVVALVFFTAAFFVDRTYMLTYANYLAEIIILLFLGSHRGSIEDLRRLRHGIVPRFHRWYAHMERTFTPYAFLVLRVGTGISLIYASIYAKIIHNNLAVETVIKYNLTNYFHFSPDFLVLGASLLEILLGILILLGIEIRFASFFFATFLTLSLLYFGEAVWPHLILFGIAIALFTHGYDRYSLEGRFFARGRREPVL